MISCCKDCEARHVGCHSTCPDYLRDKKKHDSIKLELEKKREFDSYFIESVIKQSNRSKKKKRR